MPEITEVINSYIAAWNETDDERRLELVSRAWAPDATYTDPLMSGEGHEGIAAMIAAAQEQFPGHRFELSFGPDAHNDRVRFAWHRPGATRSPRGPTSARSQATAGWRRSPASSRTRRLDPRRATYCRPVSANVEFLRQGYEALERGDLDTFEALARERLGPDFEFHLVWDGRVLRGFEGTQEWIADTRDTWEGYSQSLEEIVDRGEHVVVVVSISGRGGESGVPVAQELAVVWTFEGERAVQARSFTSRAEAFAALGEAEPPREAQ